jgi:hypothetical protein
LDLHCARTRIRLSLALTSVGDEDAIRFFTGFNIRVLEAYASSEAYIAAMNMTLHFKVGSVGTSPVIELEEGDDRTDPVIELQIRVSPDQPKGGTCVRSGLSHADPV